MESPMPTGNPFRVLSLPLSLSLILAAGLALTGCGDDDSSTTTPAPAPAPPTPPAPPAPDPVGVPGGLKVTATGPDFLEFTWEAVEGATGYEIQLSLTEGDWTSVETATVTTTRHRFTVAPEKTGYARVRAREGDRQSAWSGTASGTSGEAPVPPLVLSAPSPTVSSTGPDHIEWSWEAVADALAYEVRVAETVAGLDAASSETVSGTTHRVDAEPEMEMFLRVRAQAGTPESPVSSDWSDAVAGMSDAAPTPFVVSMRPPEAEADKDCSGQVFCADDGTDAETAMASVNPKMMVSLSAPARIRPLFVEGAAGVPVDAGEGMAPFAYVDWNALQAEVVRDGVTFEFRRMTTGAGQEPMPTGDTRYITCSPFRCSEAAAEMPEAPEITTDDAAACREFEVDFELVQGIVDNRGAYRYNNTVSVQRSSFRNGVDAGWKYTLSHPAKLTHEFTTIPAATPSGTMTVPGKPLTVSAEPRVLDMVPAASPPANLFGAPANRDSGSFWSNFYSQSDPGPIRSHTCWPASGTTIWANGDFVSYNSINRSLGAARDDVALRQPESCFTLITDGIYEIPVAGVGANFARYHEGYLLHVDPQVGVSWMGSAVDWGDDDPFEDLQCERVTIPAIDQLDVCGDFQRDAEAFWGKGLGAGGQFRVEYRLSGSDNTNGKIHHLVVRNGAGPPVGGGSDQAGREYRPRGSRHGNMWLVVDEPGTSGNRGIDGTKRDKDMYRMYSHNWSDDDMQARERWTGGAPATNGVVDWRPIMSRKLEDEDGDPIYGDFGKIDMVNAAGDPGSDGRAENMDDPVAARCTDADGPGCDSVQDFDLSATFTRLRDTNECTFTAEVSLTCTWDADGDRRREGDTAFDTDIVNGENRFLRCEPN